MRTAIRVLYTLLGFIGGFILVCMIKACDCKADTVGDKVAHIALLTDVPVQLLIAVCTVESEMQEGEPYMDEGSLSYRPCGLKLAAARDVGFDGPADDLKYPMVNAFFAAMYLKKLAHRYQGDWDRAVVAFNLGMRKVDKMTAQQCFATRYHRKIRKAYKHGYHGF